MCVRVQEVPVEGMRLGPRQGTAHDALIGRKR